MQPTRSPATSPQQTRWFEALLVLVLVLFGAWVRLDTAAADGIMTRAPERGLLKSDPGLLYYLTSQVANAEGWLPDDWNADVRIAFPETIDIPADYTVGQEFLLGWSWRLAGGDTSLFLWCHYGAAWLAALAAIGVWGLARELCAKRWPALAACLLYLLLPASYRTIGFVLIREDLSLTFFALHLWLGARAARLGTRSSFFWAVASACLALATWHAMAFILLLEAAGIFAVFLLRGRNPVNEHGPLVLGLLLAAYCLIPSLGGAAFWAGFAFFASLWAGNRLGPARPRLAACGILAIVAALAFFASTGSESNFGHVYEVLMAKIRYGGVLPADPGQLSFDARLLWQGPFATLDPALAPSMFGVAFVIGLPASLVAIRSRSGVAACLGLMALASLPIAWLIMRMTCLPALLLPPLCALLFVRLRHRFFDAIPTQTSPDDPRGIAELGAQLVPILGLLLLIGQLAYFFDVRLQRGLSWYGSESRVNEIAQMVDAVERFVPPGQAVAGDFMSSTTILAQTQRPILLQPKWEREPARRRVQLFWKAFYGGSPENLRRQLLDEYDCHYLLVDRHVLWRMRASRYLAGLPADQNSPSPGTAAEVLLGAKDPGIEGFRLLWSSQEGHSTGPAPNLQLFALD